MQRFDPNGWLYTHTSPLRLVGRLPGTHFDRASRTEFVEALRHGGGKAFGLSLCQKLAEKDVRLRVPPWIWLRPSQQRDPAVLHSIGERLCISEDELVILRSSDFTEDWMLTESGEHESKRTSLKRAPELISHMSLRNMPHVVQAFKPGIGIVVDIAYSQLLQAPVIRVATGREFNLIESAQRFSSATNDHEGVIALYSILGKPILTPQHGLLYNKSVLSLPLQEVAQTLAALLIRSGIRFGVQVELVVHPEKPDEWWLVQIRPTPGRVRPIKTLGPLPKGDLIVSSAAVSGSYLHTDKARLMNDDDYKWLLMVFAYASETEGLRDGILRFGDHGIILWHKRPHADWGVSQMLMLHSYGVVGQITTGPMTTNSTHGTLQRRIERVEIERDQLLHRSALLGLHDQAHGVLSEHLKSGSKTLTLVSDGIVGQVYDQS